MTNRSAPIFAAFLIDCLLLVVALMHIPTLQQRSAVPFTVSERNGTMVIEEVSAGSAGAGLTPGDTVLAVNGSAVTIPQQLEFIGDLLAIGDRVTVTAVKNGAPHTATVTAERYYPSLLYIIIAYFVGLSFFCVGVFVLWNRPRDAIAHLFHGMMVLVGTAVMLTWGRIEPGSLQTTAVRSLFFVTYAFGIASFTLFTFLYCAVHPRFIMLRAAAVYGTAAVLSGTMVVQHLDAVRTGSLTAFAQFQWTFDLFHAAIIAAFIAGVTNIIRAYRRAGTPEDRNRLEWILWGFTVSSSPFLLLYIIPQLLFDRYLVPEEYTTIFFIVLPFSFGVSFIKHHLFDIRLLIKRTIVTTLFSVLIAAAYIIIVLLSAALIDESVLTTGQFVAVAVTLIITMALNPVRIRLGASIDRLLFKAKAEYGRIIAGFSGQLQHAVSEEDVFAALETTVRSNLPVEQCILFRRNDDLLRSITAEAGNPENAAMLAVGSILRSPVPADVLIDDSLPERTGVELLLLVRKGPSEFGGALGIRRTQVREQFEQEEMSLLSALCRHAGEHLERLALMETVFREKEERRHAEVLNRQKSDFVSIVSHELQTPLTSIRMFTELLLNRTRDTKTREQVSIIRGEAERLSRMVNNLLDVTRIESGLKEYRPEPCSMNDLITSVAGTMSYMIERHGFTLRTALPRRPVIVVADKDAMEQALMNLISNAIKYSRNRRRITITLTRKRTAAVCTVEDRGDGIPAEQIPKLFHRFYRQPQHQHTVSGIGIGLSLVKHIIDAHHGTIRVRSTVGKGTAFTITLPLAPSSRP